MKIIIVGSGRMGSGLALELSLAGHDITVIDSDSNSLFRLGKNFKGKAIQGIGFDRDILIEAGIERADAIAALTSNDEANAVIARMSREIFKVPKVVAGLTDNHKANIYKKLGIQVVSPIEWGIKRAIDILAFSALHTVYSIGEGRVDIKVIDLPMVLEGHKVRELNAQGEVKVIALTRNNETIIPTEETIMRNGDLVYVSVETNSNSKLKSLLGIVDGRRS
ncbi:MAG: trk system potassium uptake protein TrkA [Fusobacteria bacterium]|nr:MAG: trk system potassium uptake protein TrkA [Fusobacteriota bacterium]KAF0228721.1 MAG: trk system potassium uptake protein [Fusobacteriota bacterium]